MALQLRAQLAEAHARAATAGTTPTSLDHPLIHEKDRRIAELEAALREALAAAATAPAQPARAPEPPAAPAAAAASHRRDSGTAGHTPAAVDAAAAAHAGDDELSASALAPEPAVSAAAAARRPIRAEAAPSGRPSSSHRRPPASDATLFSASHRPTSSLAERPSRASVAGPAAAPRAPAGRPSADGGRWRSQAAEPSDIETASDLLEFPDGAAPRRPREFRAPPASLAQPTAAAASHAGPAAAGDREDRDSGFGGTDRGNRRGGARPGVVERSGRAGPRPRPTAGGPSASESSATLGAGATAGSRANDSAALRSTRTTMDESEALLMALRLSEEKNELLASKYRALKRKVYRSSLRASMLPPLAASGGPADEVRPRAEDARVWARPCSCVDAQRNGSAGGQDWNRRMSHGDALGGSGLRDAAAGTGSSALPRPSAFFGNSGWGAAEAREPARERESSLPPPAGPPAVGAAPVPTTTAARPSAGLTALPQRASPSKRVRVVAGRGSANRKGRDRLTVRSGSHASRSPRQYEPTLYMDSASASAYHASTAGGAH